MSAAPPPRAKPRNRRWTVPEVAALATEVRNVGEQKGKWKLIAQVVSTKGDGRSSHDCLLRWTQVDDPKIKKGAWTDEETDRLHEAVDLYGKNWVEVAKHVGSGRTPHSCQRRLKSRPAQLKWTDEELFLLHGLVGNSDQVDWQKVADDLNAKMAAAQSGSKRSPEATRKVWCKRRAVEMSGGSFVDTGFQRSDDEGEITNKEVAALSSRRRRRRRGPAPGGADDDEEPWLANDPTTRAAQHQFAPHGGQQGYGPPPPAPNALSHPSRLVAIAGVPQSFIPQPGGYMPGHAVPFMPTFARGDAAAAAAAAAQDDDDEPFLADDPISSLYRSSADELYGGYGLPTSSAGGRGQFFRSSMERRSPDPYDQQHAGYCAGQLQRDEAMFSTFAPSSAAPSILSSVFAVGGGGGGGGAEALPLSSMLGGGGPSLGAVGSSGEHRPYSPISKSSLFH